RDADLCRGPARLCQALGLTGADDGTDLVAGWVPRRAPAGERPLFVADDGLAPPAVPACGPRVGVGAGGERPWRWYVAGDSHVSVWRPGGAGARNPALDTGSSAV
ncbi:MAG: DNA-3-methyladenine glycosylase, partial [Gemmatimonadales bacterium]